MAKGGKQKLLSSSMQAPVYGDFLFFKPRTSDFPVRSTLNKRHLGSIMAAIRAAWEQLASFPYTKSAPFEASHLGDEDELTTKLVEILNHLLQRNLVSGFRAAWFQDVVRDAKQSTASLDSFDQMPDMAFRMVAHSPQEDRSESGLFVECKLVSKASGCAPYVSEGLVRFVSGRYAPQMGFGLMLGYCTQSFSQVDVELAAYFKFATKPESLLCKSVIAAGKIVGGCHETIHNRALPANPNFCALHLWLVRPGVA
jgi:hypothetical protein